MLSIDEDTAERNKEILDMVTESKKPWMGIITKVDLKDFEHRVLILKALIEERGGKALTVSNKKDGQEDREALLLEILQILPDSQAPLYDEDMFTTENVRDLAEEIIREKCFEALSHEVPYQMAIQIRKFDEEAKPCPKIYVDVIVNKESHKPMVIGKGAETIKKIGQNSRKEIEALMGEKIYLDLNVTVKENWFENKQMLKELKYVVDSE